LEYFLFYYLKKKQFLKTHKNFNLKTKLFNKNLKNLKTNR